MSQKKINLKKTFQELDDILDQLESADLDIDKMIKLYENIRNGNETRSETLISLSFP